MTSELCLQILVVGNSRPVEGQANDTQTRQCWEKATIHHPAAVGNFSLPKEMGGHRGKISVVDIVFLFF